jgi:hypothetical protein
MNIESAKFDILADIGESALDQIIENDFLKEIPVLGTAVNIARLGYQLRERAFINKVSAFLSHLPKHTQETQKILLQEIEKDSKRRLKFGEALFFTLEQADSLVKAEYAAIVFTSFIRGEISDRELRALCHSIRVTQSDELIEFSESKTLRQKLLRDLSHTGLVSARFSSRKLNEKHEVATKPQYGFTKNGGILRNLLSKAKMAKN